MTDKDRAMPPLVAIAGALGSAAIVRWAYRTAKRINHELEEARLARVTERAEPADVQTLRRDPATGAYRPGLNIKKTPKMFAPASGWGTILETGEQTSGSLRRGLGGPWSRSARRHRRPDLRRNKHQWRQSFRSMADC
jgi:hypothetical protein